MYFLCNTSRQNLHKFNNPRYTEKTQQLLCKLNALYELNWTTKQSYTALQNPKLRRLLTHYCNMRL